MTFLSVLAATSLVAAACSSGDDDEAVSEGSTEATSAETEPEGTTAETESTEAETDGTEAETADTEAETEKTLPAGAENVGKVGESGCGIPHGPYDDPGEPAGEVRVAWNDPLQSFNSMSARGNATANNNPLYLLGRGTGGGFYYYDGDLNLINNDSFGTCTVESLDPLTVTYRINEGVTWSDGTQIDAADLILTWGATGTHFNEEGAVVAGDGTTAEADADGKAIVLDASGTPVADPAVYDADSDDVLDEGYTYKPSAGVSFDAVDESLKLVSTLPTISEDGLAATITWDSFYVDYQTNGLAVGVPAHTVGRLALGAADPAAAKEAVIAAFRDKDTAAIKKISEVWNTGFDTTSLPDDGGVYLSMGPYNMTSYAEEAEMTFEINPEYDFGPKPHIATVVYKIIGEPTAAVQALENEEVDIIQPQSTADILTQLEALKDRGVELRTGDAGTYEHVDLVMNNGGPFDPATYGDDAAKALAVRQAFLKTIPRQEIIDRLIVPLNPNARLRDSFTTVVGAPTYDALVAENGSAEFAEVDIEGAKALLAEAGVTGVTDVRFLFGANNPRRANEYELIRDSAKLAGFNVIDGNSPTWNSDLDNESLYDASLFGWQSEIVGVADTEGNFRTDSQNNFGGYSSPEVDALYDQLKASTDATEQQDLLLQIEKHLWADGFGVTIFQFPEITAWNTTYVTGVSSIALAPTVFWNFWEWEVAS